jgi:hypothetical protein
LSKVVLDLDHDAKMIVGSRLFDAPHVESLSNERGV